MRRNKVLKPFFLLFTLTASVSMEKSEGIRPFRLSVAALSKRGKETRWAMGEKGRGGSVSSSGGFTIPYKW